MLDFSPDKEELLRRYRIIGKRKTIRQSSGTTECEENVQGFGLKDSKVE